MPPTDDVAVIGGGVIGASIAECLARRGMSVRVIDRGEPGGGTSPRSFGLVDVLAPDHPPYMRARTEAIAEVREWLRATDRAAAVGWAQCGSLTPAWPADATRVRATLPAFAAAGVAAEWWPAGDLRSREPHLNPALAGAVHLPGDGCLDPAAYLQALRAAAVEAGAAWEVGEARRVHDAAGAWSVALADGRGLRARRVVVAAGVWSGGLLTGLPVAPVRGTVLTTEPAAPMLSSYTPLLRQLPGGAFWIGGSHEHAGYSLEADPEVKAGLRADAVRMLPALGGVAIAAVRTGLRPMPRDGRPIAGAWPGAPGLFIAVTHSGITLSRWLGSRVAALVAGERATEAAALAPYTPARFDGV